MDLAVVFSFLNILGLVVLLSLYGGILRRTRSAYPAGLMIFAALLLGQNVLTAYSYLAMTTFFGSTVLPYLAVVAILQFGGLMALTRITL